MSTSFESYHEVFLEINNTTSNIDSIMDTGSIWYTYSLVFLGIVGLLTLIFVCRVLFLPSTNKDDDDSDSDSSDDVDDGSYYSNDSISKNKKTFPWICVQSYILIPIYFISFFLLLFSTCGFAIFVVINADICTTNGSYDGSDGNGGPDTNIMAIAEYKLKENNESAYNGKLYKSYAYAYIFIMPIIYSHFFNKSHTHYFSKYINILPWFLQKMPDLLIRKGIEKLI